MATKGQIDIYASQATWEDRIKHIFTRMYAGLYTASVAGMLELVALQFGNGGSGTASSPVFGNRAFAVFRWKKNGEVGITTTRDHSFYLLIQYSADGNIAGAEGPGAIENNTGLAPCMLGVAAAMGDTSSADASPWTGSTHANGTDTKGSPVWGSATNVFVYPRANAGDGSAANKRDLARLIARNGGAGAVSSRAHMVFNEDNITFFVSPENNGLYDMVAFVHSSPRAAIASGLPVPPMTMIRHGQGQGFAAAAYPPNNDHYNGTFNGGTLGRTGTTTFDTVCTQLSVGPFLDTNWEPNKQLEPNTYEEAPIEYAVNDTDGRNGRMGNLGDFLRVCANVPTNSTNSGRTRAVLGPTLGSGDWRWVVDWDGATDPGVSTAPDGIAF